jgi:ABC-type sugar transport system permease subunit
MEGGSSIAGSRPLRRFPEGETGAWRAVRARSRLPPRRLFLLIWIVYPAISTIYRSFFDKTGDEFVWSDNYTNLFTNDRTLTAIKNNFLWLLIVPPRDGDWAHSPS